MLDSPRQYNLETAQLLTGSEKASISPFSHCPLVFYRKLPKCTILWGRKCSAALCACAEECHTFSRKCVQLLRGLHPSHELGMAPAIRIQHFLPAAHGQCLPLPTIWHYHVDCTDRPEPDLHPGTPPCRCSPM